MLHFPCVVRKIKTVIIIFESSITGPHIYFFVIEINHNVTYYISVVRCAPNYKLYNSAESKSNLITNQRRWADCWKSNDTVHGIWSTMRAPSDEHGHFYGWRRKKNLLGRELIVFLIVAVNPSYCSNRQHINNIYTLQ